jgi:hypothetical protein
MSLQDLLAWQPALTIAAGFATIVVAIPTFLWRRMQRKTWKQNEQFQSDSHTLKLCQALSDPSPRLRMAAAALLFERLKQGKSTSDREKERSAIVQALLAATVGDPTHGTTTNPSPELCKYIADSIAEALMAQQVHLAHSPLKKYYWQRVQLKGAYWKQIDARGVDFFGANFDGASLRRANLNKATFYDASLVGTNLSGANICNADFRGADLRDANLQDDDRPEGDLKKTEWESARFTKAKYNSNTKFPPNFDPTSLGMTLIENEKIRISA